MEGARIGNGTRLDLGKLRRQRNEIAGHGPPAIQVFGRNRFHILAGDGLQALGARFDIRNGAARGGFQP